MEHSTAVLRNKAKFIQMVADGQIDLVGGQKSKAETSKTLREAGFNTITELEDIKNKKSLHLRYSQNDTAESDVLVENESTSEADFDYLLKMPLSSLTREKIEDLTKDASKTELNLKETTSTTPEELWMSDLDKLSSQL